MTPRARKVTQDAPSPADEARQCPLVGIGASAGGLESFARLLRSLPECPGMAFVLVQHLDPVHESLLAEILQRASKMEVIEVTDGMRVEASRVYVMPPNVTMVVTKGVLVLSPRPPVPAETLPIDGFFRSLAAECESRSVGIVLSGTGADGAEGLAAIKEAGGITFAQDPASAGYDGMPTAAIDAGVVDTVGDPETIAEALVRLARQMSATEPGRSAGGDGEIDEQSLGAILALVRHASGLDLTHYRRTTLVRRISRRMLLGGFDTFEDYLAALRANESEVGALYRDILVNVTEFFRDPEALDALRDEAFPDILSRKGPDTTFRIWVPGCSKGQEAYSIVISLVEFLEAASVRPSVQMFATDVSATDIAFARAGAYPTSIEEKVSPERLARFFRQVPGGYVVDQAIREMCVFAVHDVTKDPPFSKLDLVSFRNVLIYMERPLQKRVLQVLHYALEPGGFLLLGSSETTGGETALFSVVDRKRRLYVRKTGPARLVPAAPRLGEEETRSLSVGMEPAFSVAQEAERVVLDVYAPPGLLVNSDMDVLQFRGNVTPYLEPAKGAPELTLAKMVTPGVATSARAAILEAASTGVAARRAGFATGADGVRLDVEVEAVPISAPTGERYYLVLFEPRADMAPRPDGHGPTRRKSGARSPEVADLLKELDETRRNLEAVVAEKEAANGELRLAGEKLQTGNEELRTINEEFQTAQEELQSTNEELTTLNDELRSRNGELIRLNDDLDNVIRGVEIPILILGGDLRIRRFTPQVDSVVNILPTDVGRPVTDFTFKVDVPDFPGVVEQVMRTLAPSQTDVTDAEGHWYSMRIRPYRTSAEAVDGIVVAFVDTDELKHASEVARLAQEHAEAVVESMTEPLLTLSSTLQVLEANKAFYETFRVSPEETIGSHLYELGDGQWDIPELRALLEQVLPGDTEFADLEVEHDFPWIGRRVMVLGARRVREEHGLPSILFSIDDVTTSRRQARIDAALNEVSLKISSTLELDDVLDDVLEIASLAVSADSGTILLKQDNGWLVKSGFGVNQPTVGQVLEEDRVPLSVFSAECGDPVLVPDVSQDERFQGSIGKHLGHHCVLMVPLLFRQQTIGSISFHHVVANGVFSEGDVSFAKRLGALLSLAFENARLYGAQRLIANTLQTALLTPPRRVPGVDFGYLYRSATETASVGGDLYDLFELSEHCVGVLIGDVSGKGVEAATLAGLIKNTIRALSYGSDSPAEVIAKTNEVVFRSTSSSMFATLLLCFLDTESGRLVYCSAGHLPGIVRRSGTGAVELMRVGSPLAGAFSELEFDDGETSIGKGDLLVLYTDGVTEARRGKELLGEERLVEMVRHLGALPAEKAAETIFCDVLEFAGGRLSDDVAIISVGRT